MRRPYLALFLRRMALAVWLPAAAIAYPTGESGYSGQTPSVTCFSCHIGTSMPQVTLQGPTTAVAPGSVVTFTFTITGGPAQTAGLDVSVDNPAASLKPVDGSTQLMRGELTQTAPLTFSANSASFSFQLVAPPTSGVVTVHAAGLSSNGQLDTFGDGQGLVALPVTVGSGAPPDAGHPDGGGGGGSAGGAPDAGLPPLTAAPQVQLFPPNPPMDGIVMLQATAQDSVGISEVIFLVDGAAVGAASAPPYTLTLDTMLLSAGKHQAAAQAVTPDGRSAMSPPVAIMVTHAAPTAGGCSSAPLTGLGFVAPFVFLLWLAAARRNARRLAHEGRPVSRGPLG